MARKRDTDEPVFGDRKNFAADIADDEFEDEATAPVLPIQEAEDGDDAHEEPVTVLDHALTAKRGEDAPLEAGFVLRDRFEIVSLVHTGGMSYVYKAIDRRRHPPGSEQSYVAIKMLRPSVLPAEEGPATLEREAARAQHLAHPNIVNIYDFDMHDGEFYLVMEWLEGESLKELLQRTSGRPLAPEFAWQVIHGVASALEHAHSNSVVHADINLSNIFITDTQQIKLLDFGVARCGMDREGAAADELIWVTHKYASPEVLSGSVPVFADDIFSLGCVAYRLLSGRHPFAGASPLKAKESGLAVRPVPGLSVGQWQILSRALRFARSERPIAVSVFLDQQPAWSGEIMRRVRAVPREAWLIALPLAAIVLAVGLWLLLRSGPIVEPAVDPPPAIVAEPVLTDTVPEAAVLDETLRKAGQAMSAQRYVSPDDENARLLYGAALAIEPGNPTALAGLRRISDVYVQQASMALSAGELAETAAALEIAAATDPGNPAIAIVNELLMTRVNAQLANARLAAAEGDLSQAAALLSEAERYPVVDVEKIDEVRQLIAASSEEQHLIEALAAADAHMAAGRLTVPAGNNAHTLLLELRERHGSDTRLGASIDRLGDKLLAEAVIASAAQRNAQARRLLGAAESLGVDPAEIERTRRVVAADAAETRSSQPVAESAPATAPEEPETAAGAAGETALLPVEGAETSATPTVAGAPATDVAPQPRLVSLADMEIENYVAPVFPRSALRRGLTGSVAMRFSILADGSTGDIEVTASEPGDVFVSSARTAVSKWRFAPPGEVLRANVTVRFEEK